MKGLITYGFLAIAMISLGVVAFAQQPPMTEEEKQEKALYESIQNAVDKYETTLDLEYWQIFYVDSILTANTYGMKDELMALNAAKVSNPDLYQMAQDKWMERTYQSFHKILDENQWAKYLKGGAAREKKARDKRAMKIQQADEHQQQKN